MSIERGWFYLADLNPRQGSEPGKTRPVLVFQTDLLNQVDHPSSIVIPVTTNVQDNAEPLRVRIPAGGRGFDVDSDLMIDQIRAIDNRRLYKRNSHTFIKKIAPASSQVMAQVKANLQQVLDLY
jgi:mRNA interferase MazF